MRIENQIWRSGRKRKVEENGKIAREDDSSHHVDVNEQTLLGLTWKLRPNEKNIL